MMDIVNTSSFDTDFASQMKLTKLPINPFPRKPLIEQNNILVNFSPICRLNWVRRDSRPFYNELWRTLNVLTAQFIDVSKHTNKVIDVNIIGKFSLFGKKFFGSQLNLNLAWYRVFYILARHWFCFTNWGDYTSLNSLLRRLRSEEVLLNTRKLSWICSSVLTSGMLKFLIVYSFRCFRPVIRGSRCNVHSRLQLLELLW